MRIATYNVNGINARLPVLLRWLEKTSPDIVCLQELKSPVEKIPKKEIEEAGYQAIWHGQKRWNGVAILSRGKPIVELKRVLPGDPEDKESRYMEARIDKMHVVCLYLPNGNPAPGPKFDYKMLWLERLKKRAKALIESGEPVILAGDFNVIPTESDVYKPERWTEDALFLPEVRSAFHELIEQGWTDAIRALYPDEVIYTFWDYYRNAFARNAGLRIDHFLLSQGLEKKIRKGGVDVEVRGWERSSDHAPVWIEI